MFRKFKTKVTSLSSEISSSLANIGNDILSIKDEISLTRNKRNVSSIKSPSESTSDLTSIHSSELESQHTAAQDLLHRYELDWQSLHSNMDSNVTKLKSLQSDVSDTETRVLQSEKAIRMRRSEVQELPNLLSNIHQIADRIVEIRSLTVILEDDLAVLEQICLAKEDALAKQVELAKLESYRKMKNDEIHKLEVEKRKEHANIIRRGELKRQEEMKEKQVVYQKAFDEDMKRYLSHQDRKARAASLESIDIQPSETDQKALEDFLDAPVENLSEDVVKDVGSNSKALISDEETNPEIVPNSHPEAIADKAGQPSKDDSRLRSDTESTNRTDQSAQSRDSHKRLEDSLEWDDEGDDINTISGQIDVV